MKERAERLAVHSFLSKRIDSQTFDPDAPVALKTWPTTFAPATSPALQLPSQPTKADQDHGKENHLHPGRDVTEDLTGGVIQVDRNHDSSSLKAGAGPRSDPEQVDGYLRPAHRLPFGRLEPPGPC